MSGRVPRRPVRRPDREAGWLIVREALDGIYDANGISVNAERVYRSLYYMVLEKNGEWIYDNIVAWHKNRLATYVARFVALADDVDVSHPTSPADRPGEEAILDFSLEILEHRFEKIEAIATITTYLDRAYVQFNKRPSVPDALHRNVWSDFINASIPAVGSYDTVLGVLALSVSNQTFAYHSGSAVDRARIRRCIAAIKNVSGETESETPACKPIHHFTELLADRSQQYYASVAQAIMSVSSLAEICKAIRRHLHYEELSSHTFLTREMEGARKAIVDSTLITPLCERLPNVDSQGLKSLIQSASIDSLVAVYEVVGRVRAGRDALILEFGNWLTLSMTENTLRHTYSQPLASSAQELPSSIQWLSEVVQLRKQGEVLAQEAFGSDPGVQKELISATNNLMKQEEALQLLADALRAPPRVSASPIGKSTRELWEAALHLQSLVGDHPLFSGLELAASEVNRALTTGDEEGFRHPRATSSNDPSDAAWGHFAEDDFVTPGKICGKCAEVIDALKGVLLKLPSLKPSHLGRFPHHSQQDLRRSFHSGCHLCTLLFLNLRDEAANATVDQAGHPFFSLDASISDGPLWNADSKTCKYSIRLSICSDEGDTVSGYLILKLLLEETGGSPGSDVQGSRREQAQPRLAYSKRFPVSNCSQSTIDLAKSWISECKSTHRECQRNWSDLSETGRKLPTRLVDVGSKDSKIRVLRTTELPTHLWQRHCLEEGQNMDDIEYVALSHLWGSSGFTKLTDATYLRMREGFFLEELPQTWQDAIHITRLLGYRYIWIDALCIIQKADSQDLWSDWEYEAGLMTEIYGNCSVNLAALSLSSSTDSGFLCRRNPLLHIPCDLTDRLQANSWPANYTLRAARITAANSEPATCNIQRILERCGQSDYATAMRQEPLNKRGWVVQERSLSPRTLYFGKSCIFWDCRELERSEFATEYDTEPYPDQAQPQRREQELANIKKTLFRLDNGHSEKGANAAHKTTPDGWYSLVEMYGQAGLTFESDRLIAISGVARLLWKLTEQRSGYNAGIWENTLIPDLLWCVSDPMPSAHGPGPAPESTAPNFSWASLNQPARLYWPFRDIVGATVRKTARRPNARVTEFQPLGGQEIELTGYGIHEVDAATYSNISELQCRYDEEFWSKRLSGVRGLCLFLDAKTNEPPLHLVSLARMFHGEQQLWIELGLILRMRSSPSRWGEDRYVGKDRYVGSRLGMYIDIRDVEGDFLTKPPELIRPAEKGDPRLPCLSLW